MTNGLKNRGKEKEEKIEEEEEDDREEKQVPLENPSSRVAREAGELEPHLECIPKRKKNPSRAS